jgi:PhnB protein
MSRVNTYLNFMGNTEEAFTFYRDVFGTDFETPIIRFADVPANPDMPPLTPAEQSQIMHIELPITGGHILMATDMLESMGHQVRIGNNTTISLDLDSREEADRLYDALSQGASDATGMNDMPWGAYWGCCLDRFGIRWMFSYSS